MYRVELFAADVSTRVPQDPSQLRLTKMQRHLSPKALFGTEANL